MKDKFEDIVREILYYIDEDNKPVVKALLEKLYILGGLKALQELKEG